MQLFLLQTTLFILFKCVCVYPFFLHIYIYTYRSCNVYR